MSLAGAERRMLRAPLSKRDCRKVEGNVIDRMATIRDGILMLKILSHV